MSRWKNQFDVKYFGLIFVFQAEDGIRGAQESRGLGDVYKRQGMHFIFNFHKRF